MPPPVGIVRRVHSSDSVVVADGDVDGDVVGTVVVGDVEGVLIVVVVDDGGKVSKVVDVEPTMLLSTVVEVEADDVGSGSATTVAGGALRRLSAARTICQAKPVVIIRTSNHAATSLAIFTSSILAADWQTFIKPTSRFYQGHWFFGASQIISALWPRSF